MSNVRRHHDHPQHLNYNQLIARTRDELRSCDQTTGHCRRCVTEFKVDQQTHLKHRGFVQQKMEYGGSLTFDFGKRLLTEGTVQTGAYNNISMSRGGVDWHSHPARCLNDKTCALGLPSPMDLQNITLGMLFGTVAHLVYAREGTYLVRLDHVLFKKLKSSLDDVTLFFANVDRTFSALHESFIQHPSEAYKSYCRRWRRVAQQIGFRITLFTGHKVPHIKFKCLCDLLSSKRSFIPQVEVPDELEKSLAPKH